MRNEADRYMSVDKEVTEKKRLFVHDSPLLTDLGLDCYDDALFTP